MINFVLIEALRVSLDIETLSIYAGSYGTRLALSYARDFPTSISSMVLDSPLPHNASFDDEFPENFKNVLLKIVETCKAQTQCTSTFPNLFPRFLSTIEEVAENPWSFTKPDGSEVTLKDYELVSLINIGSYDAIRRVPITMDAIARKDIQLISSLLDRQSTPTNFAWGMRLSVWCSESLPFSRRSLGLNANTFASLDGAVISPEICNVWDVRKRPESEKFKTVSEVPTLIIAGDFDTLTPPKWGQLAAQTLSNSHVANVPFGLHSETKNWSGDGCAMAIASEFLKNEAVFLDNPSVYTECLKKRQPPEFILSFD